MEEFLSLLPDEYRRQIRMNVLRDIEEIRLRVGQPMLIRGCDTEMWLQPRATASMLEELLSRICRHSTYAHQETLRKGYVTMEGGHRIGVSGTAVMHNGEITSLLQPSSLVFRVAREILGCADGIVKSICASSLVIGPPCCGKTTLLRDIVRQISDVRKQRVSLVDERGEVAAVLRGVPQMDVGCRTDVLINVPKNYGTMWMLRTMNPQWIAVDEITTPEDIRSLEYASYCGVGLLATAHASDLQDLYQRPLYQEMMQKNIFRKVVLIGKDRTYTIQEV